MDLETIENNFTYHAPKGDQLNKYESLREGGKLMATLILLHVPESAERTTAIHMIEGAIMWANAGIARNE